ncbi:MAG: AbrB/MazE/SpoVT family DNA-binding domain-containing protein [Candidatus Hodarchaeota archaeon]
MSSKHLAKIGSKGELFLPTKLRVELNLKPGQKVYYYIQNGRLIVEPIPDLKEILRNKKPKIKLSLEELRKDRHELSKAAEQ